MKIIEFIPIKYYCSPTETEDDTSLYLTKTITGRVELCSGTEIMVDMADGQFICEFYPFVDVTKDFKSLYDFDKTIISEGK